MFRIRSERAIGAHSQTWGRCLTPGEIIDRVHSERLHAAAQETRARQAAIAAAFDAPTLTLPVVVDAEVIDAEIVDPVPTLPLRRAELLALPEVDGGRPLHDLDYIKHAVTPRPAIAIGDHVKITTPTGIEASGPVLDTHIEQDGSTSYLVEWGSASGGFPARLWTSNARYAMGGAR